MKERETMYIRQKRAEGRLRRERYRSRLSGVSYGAAARADCVLRLKRSVSRG